MKRTITAILILIALVSFCQASTCCAATDEKDKSQTKKPLSKIDYILLKLNKQNSLLSTYQANIDYLYIQDPELLDSRIIRTGKIFYKKGPKAPKLIIRFDTFRQDDEKTEKRREEYHFDGVWLKIIDYKNKTVNSYQKAMENKPVDAFELISRDFPMIGFNNSENLRKNFDISMPAAGTKDDKTQIRLNLKVKKGSPYAESYTSVDFRIDRKTYLPARIITTSTEGDIYDIKLTLSNVNKNLKDSVFKLETPTDFMENKHPIKK